MQTSKPITTITAPIAHSAVIRLPKLRDALANPKPSWITSVGILTAKGCISFPQRLDYQLAMHRVY